MELARTSRCYPNWAAVTYSFAVVNMVGALKKSPFAMSSLAVEGMILNYFLSNTRQGHSFRLIRIYAIGNGGSTGPEI